MNPVDFSSTTARPLPRGQRVVVTEYGETPEDALERHFELQAQPAPDPAELQAGEVLVGIRSAAVTWVDLLMTSGQYQHMVAPPYIPGIDYAGVVLAVGAGVDPARCAKGDRVMSDCAKVGPRASGPYQHAGGFASYAVLPADGVIRMPEGLSFDEGAVLLQAYETAYHCLVTRGQLQAGETVLILGASGLTGLAAVQVAKLLGATVIAAGRSDAKLATVSEHGADHLLNTAGEGGQPRAFRDDVKAFTNGRGVDVVYDAVGGDTSVESLRCMAFGGRFLIVGWTATPNVARGKGQRGAPGANQLPTNLIQMKSLSVMGCPSAIAASKDPAIHTRRLAQVLAWAAEGRIRPYVSHVYTLTDYKTALLARWRGEVTGGCVLRP